MTKQDIENVIVKCPRLTSNGIGTQRGLTPEDREKWFAVMRDDLLKSGRECGLCCQWLIDIPHTKTIRGGAHSYRLKHVVERASKTYISNGAFICAAIHMGFQWEEEWNSPNVCFNMSVKAINKKESTLPLTRF